VSLNMPGLQPRGRLMTLPHQPQSRNLNREHGNSLWRRHRIGDFKLEMFENAFAAGSLRRTALGRRAHGAPKPSRFAAKE